MSYFSDDTNMYVPLSIDEVEVRSGNYFLSNKKMFFAVMAFLPVFIPIWILMDVGVGIIPILIVVGIYLIGYFYFARFIIFEERRLRKMIRELDENKISGIEHFWGIDKIGGGKDDDGTIYYSYEGTRSGTTRGLVVMMDRGSVIGVPKGHYTNFRRTKERFLRQLHLNGLDVQWFEIQKKPELQPSLIRHANLLSNLENEYLGKLLKLQLNINTAFSMGDQQRYIDYIVVKRSRYSKDFKKILQTAIDETLGTNNYFINPKIANKREVEDFFKNYLMMDMVDSDNIRKSVDIKPFESFAEVIRLVDSEGEEVPIRYLDEFDIDSRGGRDLDKVLQKHENIEKGRERANKELYDKEIERLNKQRNRDRITHDEYEEKQKELTELFNESDNFREDLRKLRGGKEVEEIREEREQEKETGPIMYEYEDRDDGVVSGEDTLEDLIRNTENTSKEEIEEDEDIEEDKKVESLEELMKEDRKGENE